MKKSFIALLVLGWLMAAGIAWAEPPVLLSHTLTGYSKGTDSVTLNYVLKLKNTGTETVSNLILSLDPLPLMSKDKISLKVATLDPQAEAQIPFTLTTRTLIDQNAIRDLALVLFFWDCQGSTATGSLRFPADSIEGGAL